MNFGGLLKAAIPPLILSIVTTALCYAAAGDSLGFWLGPIALCALIVPPLVARQPDRLRVLFEAGAVVDGVAVVWLIVALVSPQATRLQWLMCCLVLLAFAWALWGLTRVLRSAAVVTTIALAWLTWPVWMSPWVTASAAAWLAPAHPLLAINHVMANLGVWTQQRLMYPYTALGQDVPYAMPRSIWPCVLVHGIVGLMALLPALWRRASPPPPRGPSSESSSASPSTSASAAGS
jgi:hypothetical protein